MSKTVNRRYLLKIAGALAGASAAGLITTRSIAAEGKLRAAWWGSEERHQRTLEAFQLFSTRNPGLAITGEVAAFDPYFDKLAVQTAGGNAPDVFQISGQFINEYAARGALLDLNQYVPELLDLGGWDETVASLGVINGQMAGVPIGLDAYAIAFNRNVLEENGIDVPPDNWTWDDFAAFAIKVSEAVEGDFWGSSDGGRRYEGFETFVRQRGKTLFTADGAELGFETQDLSDWFTFWDNLRRAGGVPPAEVGAAAQGEEQSNLVQRLTAMYWTTSSMLVNLQGLMQETLGLHMHPFSADGQSGAFVRPGLFISAYAKTTAPELSAQLIDFLLNDPEAAAILRTVRGVPPSPQVRASLEGQVSATEQLGFDFVELVTSVSTQANILTPPGGTDVTRLLSRTYEAVSFERQSIPDAVNSFFKEAPQLLGV